MKITLFLFLAGTFGLAPDCYSAVITGSFQISPTPNPVTFSAPAWRLVTGRSGAGALITLAEADAALADLTPAEPSLGVDHRWFVVDAGTVFDLNYVQNQAPLAMTAPPSAVISVAFDTSFYLAAWSDTTVADGQLPGPSAGDYLGWVQLVNDRSTGLRILADATETTGRGIIVGTLNAVPEPGAGSAILLAGVLLFGRRQRRVE